jgi:hypothetical protein
VSMQLSSAVCLLGAFVVWAQTFSTQFFCWRFELSQSSGGGSVWLPAELWCSVLACGRSADLQTFLWVLCCFIILGSGRVLLLAAYGDWDMTFQGSKFPVSFRFVGPPSRVCSCQQTNMLNHCSILIQNCQWCSKK